jgi:hypothetical protein
MRRKQSCGRKYFSLCQPSKHQVGTLCSGSNGNSELSSALVVEHQPVSCQPLVHNLKTPLLHFENFESVSIEVGQKRSVAKLISLRVAGVANSRSASPRP